MSAYSPIISELIPADRLCELGPGKPNETLRPKLAALTTQSLFAGKQIKDHDSARCCLSALWLLHDFLDESHALSQEIETEGGSYWHGIMHRREPDYGNGKYWFRRVGQHAIFAALLARAKELIAAEGAQDAIAREIADTNAWDPNRFIDWCEQLAHGKAKQRSLAQRIAQSEWELLFEHCYRRALE